LGLKYDKNKNGQPKKKKIMCAAGGIKLKLNSGKWKKPKMDETVAAFFSLSLADRKTEKPEGESKCAMWYLLPGRV
jgi:hypothetical protein